MYSMDYSSARAPNVHLKTTVHAGKVAQGFEWIPHGDASARKRARAHVTRGFRREKAAQVKKDKEDQARRDSSSQSSSSPPQDDFFADSTSDRTSLIIPPDATSFQPYETTGEDAGSDPVNVLERELGLQPTLGSGRTDPFLALPVQLRPGTYALLDHFLSGVAPVSYRRDNKADFRPVKQLSFQVSLSDPSAFHIILGAAAHDIAALRGQEESSEAIMHKGLALGRINKRLLQDRWDTSDASIAAVALLAGSELLFGTPAGFNTHMKGLETMLKLRGGLEALQRCNPQLFGLVSWFDYSGSCNLVSRRRFDLELPGSEVLCSSPFGVPENILQGLPTGYDLYQTLADTFEGMRTLTALLRTGDARVAQLSDSSSVITRMDSRLYQSILDPEQKGIRSRRQHIQQSIEILVLIYAALVSAHFQNDGVSTMMFIARFKIIATNENVEWGLTVVNFFRRLLLEDEVGQDEAAAQISSLYDVCATLGWLPWRNIKRALLDFFVYDSACEGRLQVLWQRRLSAISI